MKEIELTGHESYWGLDIKKVELRYNAVFMGSWALRTKGGGWSEQPADIFYSPYPDKSKGHTHYFGIIFDGPVSYITGGDSAFSQTITGIDNGDGTVSVSRYRHDFTPGLNGAIDGGRDYLKVSGTPKLVTVIVKGPNFLIEVENETESN